MTNPPVSIQPPSPDNTVALVLQGGGALGSYQAGVYEALAETIYAPDWVAGISIGAINAAIIAGNAPADRIPRLRMLWESITAPSAHWLAPIGGRSMPGNAKQVPSRRFHSANPVSFVRVYLLNGTRFPRR